MISQTAEYALRAVACLAANAEQSLTAQEVAALTKVPDSYLSKVLQALGRAKIVRSRRGLHGGFMLARAAQAISLLDVVNAVDPILQIKECPLKLQMHENKLCGLHRRLNESICMVESAFRDSSIQDLLTGPDSQHLCKV